MYVKLSPGQDNLKNNWAAPKGLVWMQENYNCKNINQKYEAFLHLMRYFCNKSRKIERELELFLLHQQTFFAALRITPCCEGYFVVVAQMAERSLPTPEVRGSNAVIGKLLY